MRESERLISPQKHKEKNKDIYRQNRKCSGRHPLISRGAMLGHNHNPRRGRIIVSSIYENNTTTYTILLFYIIFYTLYWNNIIY